MLESLLHPQADDLPRRTRSPAPQSLWKQFLERLAALFAERKDAGTVFLTQKRRQSSSLILAITLRRADEAC